MFFFKRFFYFIFWESRKFSKLDRSNGSKSPSDVSQVCAFDNPWNLSPHILSFPSIFWEIRPAETKTLTCFEVEAILTEQMSESLEIFRSWEARVDIIDRLVLSDKAKNIWSNSWSLILRLLSIGCFLNFDLPPFWT